MRNPSDIIRVAAVLAVTLVPFCDAHARSACPAGMVRAGSACIDAYEASIWRIADPAGANKGLVKKILRNKVTLQDLTDAGAQQLGDPSDDWAPCDDDGSGCGDVYAVSLPDVLPSRWPSWFQAAEACANSGKRLPTNAEWQLAATGTPDLADDSDVRCNTGADSAVRKTGSRSACVSTRGAYDMIGNLREWVADWVPAYDACPSWGSFSDDEMCFAGASSVAQGPAALVRGGGFFDETEAGIYYINASYLPHNHYHAHGVRCAR
ncbi:MAG TPA: SUMF1/EgtB/PvdO family nonheme iron enzyme [Candidatus Binatia bacterium]|nr:SUMF1/EgtB/PvdO family nonheme iron enzyme [Candidatus Binatia bacterium]